MSLKAGNSPSTQSSSSQVDKSLRRIRRPPKQPIDDLRDMKFDSHEFRGNLNPYLYLKRVQSLERFFKIKEYSQEKAFKLTIFKLKKYVSL